MGVVKKLLHKAQFPRASRYDPDWVLTNQMGPNALWLVEWLSGAMPLEPGMRVLDLGCGRAMSSIFLARELGLRVWAADLWIGPDKNWQRVVEADVADLVCPIRAEAHDLPFAKGFFDAVVSIDAYTYFGTDDLYLSYLSSLVRPGGSIGVVVPGLAREIEGEVPAHLAEPQSNGKPFWQDDCWCFHTAEWWARHWQRCGKIDGIEAALLPDGWRYWLDFEKALELSGKGVFPSDAEALEKDQGRFIGLVRVTATRSDAEAESLYDPSIGVRFGVD